MDATSAKRKAVDGEGGEPKKLRQSAGVFREVLKTDPKRAYEITVVQAEVARDDYTNALVARAKDALAKECAKAHKAGGSTEIDEDGMVRAMRQYGLHLRIADHVDSYDVGDSYGDECITCVDALVRAGFYAKPNTVGEYKTLYEHGKYTDTDLFYLLRAQAFEGCSDARRAFLKAQGPGFDVFDDPNSGPLDALENRVAVLAARVTVARDAYSKTLLRTARDRDKRHQKLYGEDDMYDHDYDGDPDNDDYDELTDVVRRFVRRVTFHLFSAYGSTTFPDVKETNHLGDDWFNWQNYIDENTDEILDALVEAGFFPNPQTEEEWFTLMERHNRRVWSPTGCLASMVVFYEDLVPEATETLDRLRGW